MALKAGIDAHRNTFSGMAVIAAFRIGRMQNITNHPPAVASMGAMTGDTVLHLLGEIGMLLLHRIGRMAALAELFRGFDKQIAIGRLVHIMTGGALPFGVRRMGVPELLGQVCMAVEAELRCTRLEQLGRIRGMWVVAVNAFALLYWLVHLPLTAFDVRLVVTGKAYFFHLPLKHCGVPRHMRAVAGETFSGRYRLMLHLFPKRVTIVT